MGYRPKTMQSSWPWPQTPQLLKPPLQGREASIGPHEKGGRFFFSRAGGDPLHLKFDFQRYYQVGFGKFVVVLFFSFGTCIYRLFFLHMAGFFVWPHLFLGEGGKRKSSPPWNSQRVCPLTLGRAPKGNHVFQPLIFRGMFYVIGRKSTLGFQTLNVRR